MNIPDDLRYTKEHEWARLEGGQVRVGITDFAQNALGDVVFVQVPETGDLVTAGDVFGEVESTKSVSDLYAPLSGTVTAVNESLEDAPELVNSDPYGEGWLILVDPDDSAVLDGLLDAAGYRVYLDESG